MFSFLPAASDLNKCVRVNDRDFCAFALSFLKTPGNLLDIVYVFFFNPVFIGYWYYCSANVPVCSIKLEKFKIYIF